MSLSPLIALLPTPGSTIFSFLLAYALFEIGFFFHYHWYLIPHANQIDLSRPNAPYRDYPEVQDRIKLLKRIIQRIVKRIPLSQRNNDAMKSEIFYKFIESWFIKKQPDAPYEQFSKQFDMATLDMVCPPPPPMLRMAWSSVEKSELNGSGSESSLNETVGGNESEKSDSRNNIRHGNNQQGAKIESKDSERLLKDNMDEFLSWAFFGVHFTTVQSHPDMSKALDEFYQTLQKEAALTFAPGRNVNFTPRCFTFEEVNSLYRPYCVYAGVALMRISANLILTIIGFRQYTCSRGLKYWHRAARSNKKKSPFLFFHGIAPGGHAPYLPMIFFGLLRGENSVERDIFLFQNKPVSYSMCFEAVSEEDTVNGILEAVERHLGCQHERSLTVCGHSLGSCQLTMMVKSPQLQKTIQNIILIDPVSILLSEPDVMINFLYTRRESEEHEDSSNSWVQKLIRFFHESKIHLVASSELFIEHYLRRNFAWYNSELWLADIPPECNVLICLSEHDEIVNSPKVEREVSDHNNLILSYKTKALIEKIMWKGVGHAHCITHPDKWMDIHNVMSRMIE